MTLTARPSGGKTARGRPKTRRRTLEAERRFWNEVKIVARNKMVWRESVLQPHVPPGAERTRSWVTKSL